MSTLPTVQSKTAVPTDVPTDVVQSKPAKMWASGNARIVRYIAIAVVTLVVFYFVSHSRYDGVAIPATMDKNEAWPPAAAVADPPVTKESDPKAGDDPAEVLQPETPPSPPDSQGGNGNGVENDSKNTIKIKPTTDNEMAPLGMMPNEPGWQTDMMATAPGPRMNATFVTLARNSDVWQIARSIRQVEDRFNKRYNYDWVFLNDEPFDDTFKKVTSGLVSGKTHYGEIPHKHWSFPDHIDQERAKKVREDMKARKIIYGDSISYRHMCRFESGFFFWQELMMNYEYYWRVEPSIEMHCDVHYDPFRVMAEKKKKYSFTLSLYEYVETVPTLWESTKKFMKNYPQHIAKDNSMAFLSDDGGENYNLCHFWSNFEVGSLEWLRSQAYTDFFNSLDQDGGFFYERWGDAPVHSIAAGILLDKSEIHFFNDIAYFHVPFTHCPTGLQTRIDRGCHCDPKDNFDWKGYSCTAKYFDLNGIPKPEGWEEESH